MWKIPFLFLGVFSFVGFVVLVETNPASAQESTPSNIQSVPINSTASPQETDAVGVDPELILTAQTTQGPEESEFIYMEEDDAQRFGLQFSVGQTLLSGEEASASRGFNNAIGAGFGVSYRYANQLNLVVEYWMSKHKGIQTGGVLQKRHFATTVHYALQSGFFSPVGILGAGIYFSSFQPGAEQKRAGLVASSADTFGIVYGLGGKLDLANNFDVDLSAIRHHSFKYQNAKNNMEELLPFTIIGLMGTFYF